MLAHVGREEVHDHVAVVHHQPALLRFAVHAALLFMVLFRRFEYPFGKGVQHSVAGAAADDEIVGKGRDVLDVEEQNIFALLILQGFDDLMCKVECVQVSPHDIPSLRGAERRINLPANQGIASLRSQ